MSPSIEEIKSTLEQHNGLNGIKEYISKELYGVFDNNEVSVNACNLSDFEELRDLSDITKRINNINTELKKDVIKIIYSSDQDIKKTKVEITGPNEKNITDALKEQEAELQKVNNLSPLIWNLKSRLTENKNLYTIIRNEYDQLTTKKNISSLDENKKDLALIDDIIGKCNQLASNKYETEGKESAKSTRESLKSIIDTKLWDLKSQKRPWDEIALWNVEKVKNHLQELKKELQTEQKINEAINKFKTEEIKINEYQDYFPAKLNSSNTVVHLMSSHINDSMDFWPIDTINTNIQACETLSGALSSLKQRYTENIEKLKTMQSLLNFQEQLGKINPKGLEQRKTEFENVYNIATKNLKIWTDKYNPTVSNQAVRVWGDLSSPVDLKFVNWTPTWCTQTYTLCDKDGNEYPQNWGYKIKVGENTFTLKGISFDTTDQKMNIKNLQIEPLDQAQFPITFDIAVKCTITNKGGIKIAHHKPFKLKIEKPDLNRSDKENAYDEINGSTNIIDQHIKTLFTPNYQNNIERSVLWEFLKEWKTADEKKKITEIQNDTIKSKLFLDHLHREIPNLIPETSITQLPDKFKEFIVTQDVPAQYLLSQDVFKDYIVSDIAGNFKKLATKTIKDSIEKQKDRVLQEYLAFQTKLAEHPIDQLKNLELLWKWQKATPYEETRAIGRFFGKDYDNYTKFLTWSQAEFKDEKVDLWTWENWEIWEYKYNMTVTCKGVNNIHCKIEKGGNSIELHGANPHAIVKSILKHENFEEEPIPHKARCSMAISFLKGIVSSAKSKNIKLERQYKGTINYEGEEKKVDRMFVDIKDNKLIFKASWISKETDRNGNSVDVRKTYPLFDEEVFKTLHDDDALTNGVISLTKHINSIMNANLKEYNRATAWRFANHLKRHHPFSHFLKWGPLKKLWWRMTRGSTNWDFDFDTTYTPTDHNWSGEAVKIWFHDWEFTLKTKVNGEDREFTWKNLWKLLREWKDGRKDKQRIFDGRELGIIEYASKAYLKKLMTNNLACPPWKAFVIPDYKAGKSGKTYIFQNGELYYLPHTQKKDNPKHKHWRNRRAWIVNEDELPTWAVVCTPEQESQFFQNPFLTEKLFKYMRKQLHL